MDWDEADAQRRVHEYIGEDVNFISELKMPNVEVTGAEPALSAERPC